MHSEVRAGRGAEPDPARDRPGMACARRERPQIKLKEWELEHRRISREEQVTQHQPSSQVFHASNSK